MSYVYSSPVMRVATLDDIAIIADMRWQLCLETQPELQGIMLYNEFIEQCCQTLPTLTDAIHMVAEIEETIVAMLSIVHVRKIPTPGELNGKWGYLTNVYTQPIWRNLGIGGALLHYAQQWAAETELELLIVWPSDSSFSFYQRGGFMRGRDPLSWLPHES